jgi:hypothetical protein
VDVQSSGCCSSSFDDKGNSAEVAEEFISTGRFSIAWVDELDPSFAFFPAIKELHLLCQDIPKIHKNQKSRKCQKYQETSVIRKNTKIAKKYSQKSQKSLAIPKMPCHPRWPFCVENYFSFKHFN